jgi:hypothetical protein
MLTLFSQVAYVPDEMAVIVRSYHCLYHSYFLVLEAGKSIDIRSLEERTRKLVVLEQITEKGNDPF